MLLIITSNSDKLFIGVNIDDLDPQIRGFSVFLKFAAAAQFSRLNCDKRDRDRSREYANMNC